MSVTAIVGANWGDEGKGKLTDVLARESDYVVRFQGGSNAGHTIINDRGTFALHLIPAGAFYESVTNVIGPGVALGVGALFHELDGLADRGVKPRLYVSDRAQVLFPHHKLLDELEEERLADQKYGSTKSGIAPFYADKYQKIGVQVADLFDAGRLRERLRLALSTRNVLIQHLYGRKPVDPDKAADELLVFADRLQPLVCNTTALLNRELSTGKRVLVEGQLGALRDPDHGIYPFSTSSSPLAGNAAVGAGVPPHAISRVVAVVKAYSSAVGAGPFVTELHGTDAEELRARGGHAGEYGATTGRPRRVGWFDAVATRYGCMVQGATEAAITNLDCLGYLSEIPLCIAYDVDGMHSAEFPATALLEHARPVIETLPGWLTDISAVRTAAGLPSAARAYVDRLEKLIETPVRWVSNGPHRDQIIELS